MKLNCLSDALGSVPTIYSLYAAPKWIYLWKLNVEVLVSADFSSLAPAKHSSVELVELVGPRVDMQVDMWVQASC